MPPIWVLGVSEVPQPPEPDRTNYDNRMYNTNEVGRQEANLELELWVSA